VTLNGQALALESDRAEVTSQLEPYNTIAVELQLPVGDTAPAGPICEARLEIFSQAADA
jgi:hypothetical protein